MKTFTTIAAQGELGFLKLTDSLVPSTPKTSGVNGNIIIGHSETGHHHVMDATKADIYDLPESLTRLLVVHEGTTLEHLREFDTHEPLYFNPGQYLVRNLREYVPGGRPDVDPRNAVFRASQD